MNNTIVKVIYKRRRTWWTEIERGIDVSLFFKYYTMNSGIGLNENKIIFNVWHINKLFRMVSLFRIYCIGWDICMTWYIENKYIPQSRMYASLN